MWEEEYPLLYDGQDIEPEDYPNRPPQLATQGPIGVVNSMRIVTQVDNKGIDRSVSKGGREKNPGGG